MAISTKRLVEKRRTMPRDWSSEQELMRDLVIESLSPRHVSVFRCVSWACQGDDDDPCTARYIADALHISIAAAGTFLLDLVDYDLLSRYHDDYNNCFAYTLRELAE